MLKHAFDVAFSAAALVLLAPFRRTYTLLEFARVLASLDPDDLAGGRPGADRLRAVLPLATAGRALAPRPVRPKDDDVPDPFGHGRAAYTEALGLIDRATAVIAGLLAD